MTGGEAIDRPDLSPHCGGGRCRPGRTPGPGRPCRPGDDPALLARAVQPRRDQGDGRGVSALVAGGAEADPGSTLGALDGGERLAAPRPGAGCANRYRIAASRMMTTAARAPCSQMIAATMPRARPRFLASRPELLFTSAVSVQRGHAADPLSGDLLRQIELQRAGRRSERPGAATRLGTSGGVADVRRLGRCLRSPSVSRSGSCSDGLRDAGPTLNTGACRTSLRPVGEPNA